MRKHIQTGRVVQKLPDLPADGIRWSGLWTSLQFACYEKKKQNPNLCLDQPDRTFQKVLFNNSLNLFVTVIFFLRQLRPDTLVLLQPVQGERCLHPWTRAVWWPSPARCQAAAQVFWLDGNPEFVHSGRDAICACCLALGHLLGSARSICCKCWCCSLKRLRGFIWHLLRDDGSCKVRMITVVYLCLKVLKEKISRIGCKK